MSRDDSHLPARSSRAEVDAFLATVSSMAPRPSGSTATGRGQGRLIFAMDATASREPTWDRACHIQGEMFTEAATLGGLQVQLCHFRGFREFEASPWLAQPAQLAATMTTVRCRAGQTQIGRVLSHAASECRQRRVDALVLVGDCMEEDIDAVCHLAGELGLLGVPCFVFHEGGEPVAARAFREIARLTRGAYCRFDASSATELRDLLRAVAVYAAGGRAALAQFEQRQVATNLRLTHQLGTG
ncbi:MAG: VWA domain-containing protein [Ectothiorhodospiraceae bacterium]|nr:VWA domain-containing protein [Chromatiales bacterium]MCP5153500.1 VWA domain-containing protein [Ectothiorhodospiraceae bacterium]